MRMKHIKMRDGTVWSVPVLEGKPKRGDFVITVYGGGYVVAKRVGDPDPPEHPDD